LEWGYWTAPQTFIINGWVHDIHNKGYYIFGNLTPDTAVSGISGTYTGPAYGTFWTPTGPGIDMFGSFQCNVNGPSNQITDFQMIVINQTTYHSAIIDIPGVSGTFNSSSFDLNTGGDWQLFVPPDTLIDADYKGAHGALYGPNGENIGGAWGMKTNTGEGASGIFLGTKP